MPAKSANFSSAERPLYSYHRALDAVLELGAVPERLLRVFYPLWRVQVEGRQRLSTEFDELEWFLERGIQERVATSAGDLAQLFGLEEPLVRRLLDGLRRIEHLRGAENRLALTALGLASLKDHRRYEDQHTRSQVYFEALGNRPLSSEHDQVPLFERLPEHTAFQAFSTLGRRWEKGVAEQWLAQPDHRHYNLPDEMAQMALIGEEPAYLPVYVVQRRAGKPADLPAFLVFSRLPGLRDAVLEAALNADPLAQNALRLERDGLEQAVENRMRYFHLKTDAWYLNASGPFGPQVMIDGHILQSANEPDDEESNGLTLRNVGRHLLVQDWCVWLTCDDGDLRREAAIEQALEWLQGVEKTPDGEQIARRLEVLSKRLLIETLTVEDVAAEARRRGLGRAQERLAR